MPGGLLQLRFDVLNFIDDHEFNLQWKAGFEVLTLAL